MGWIKSSTLALAVAALGVVTATPGSYGQDVPGVTDDTIKIGSFGSLTGPTYLYGKIVMNGVEAVFAKVNENGGVHGRKLELVREDDRCDPATAVSAVKKLVYDHEVFAIIGGGCSNAALGAKPEIVKAGIPYNVFASVADPISHPPEDNIYTTMTTASIESRAQLRYALEQGAERIAVVAQHDAWGRARYEPLIEAMENQGIEPVVDEEMTVDANDATPQALAIQQADADAVIYVLYSKPGAILARDLFKLGHKPLLIGETAISDPVAFVEQVGVPGASDKFVTITPVCCSPSSPEVAEWRERIESMFPGDRLSVFNLFGVGSSQVMVEALRRAGPDLTREKYLDAMESIENYETDAYAGKIDCSAPDSNQCNKTVSWIKAVDGDVEVISSTRVE